MDRLDNMINCFVFAWDMATMVVIKNGWDDGRWSSQYQSKWKVEWSIRLYHGGYTWVVILMCEHDTEGKLAERGTQMINISIIK